MNKCSKNKQNVNLIIIIAFGKSRAFHLDDPDSTQTFEVIFPSHLRKSFQMKYKSLYLQKLISKSANMSILSNSIPEGLTK